MRGVLGSLVAAALSWPSVCTGAEPKTEPPTASCDQVEVSYGWQVFAIDGAALALGTAAFGVGMTQPEDDSPTVGLGLAALGAYLAGPPILHGARGHWDSAGESLGMRVGLPLGGGLTGLAVGAAICHKFEDPDAELDLTCIGMPLGFAILGGGLGVLVAMGLDATLVAREPATRAAAWTLVPSYEPRSRSVGLNAMGRF